MKKQRRDLPEASLSFLDVISCGFGAIVLLLVIAKVGDPSALEEAERQLLGSVKEYQERLFDIRGEAVQLDERLKSRKQQLSDLQERIARLKAKLASVAKQSNQLSQSQSREKEQLQLALQVLTEEMERLLGSKFQQQNQLIGGIPVDSEYIIFVIDNSGSMKTFAWEKLKIEMVNILDIYPEVKGLQVLNCNGKYMFQANRGQWLIDSPALRQDIITKLDNWNALCFSNPAPGIEKAIRNFYRPDRKISVWYMGDDFQDLFIRPVVRMVDKLNRANRGSDRLVRVHAIGFPLPKYFPPKGTVSPQAIKFANLMRELSYNNGGTFIGLNSLN
jgi:hypothetical protein